MNKLLLVDGNSLLFRAYYGTIYKSALKTSKGIPTNAIHAFSRMLISIIRKLDPSHILVAFDAAKKTKRHDKYEEYKAGRAKAPEDLVPQFKIVRDLLTSMNIKWYEKEGWEADDIIATLAKMGDDKEYEVQILSSDKDLLQLVSENICVLNNKSGVQVIDFYTKSNFYDKTGIYPEQVTDYKGLVGDSSDNLPGIKGIGDKTAVKLLEKYHSLENILENIESIQGATRTKIESNYEMGLKCKEIATLIYDVPLDFSLDDLKRKFLNGNENPELEKFLESFELFSIIKEIKKG